MGLFLPRESMTYFSTSFLLFFIFSLTLALCLDWPFSTVTVSVFSPSLQLPPPPLPSWFALPPHLLSDFTPSDPPAVSVVPGNQNLSSHHKCVQDSMVKFVCVYTCACVCNCDYEFWTILAGVSMVKSLCQCALILLTTVDSVYFLNSTVVRDSGASSHEGLFMQSEMHLVSNWSSYTTIHSLFFYLLQLPNWPSLF